MNFKRDTKNEIQRQGKDKKIQKLTKKWLNRAGQLKYSYHFEWLGRPIIQHPQDMIGIQQLIWNVKPDLIIETGVARGGSLIFYASLQELIFKKSKLKSKVIGIDIKIKKNNYSKIKKHQMSKRITLIEGSSVEKKVFNKVYKIAKGYKKIMVLLDSNHTHNHVYEELKIYAKLVSKKSYCVVFDTIIDDLPETYGKNRPWGKNDNPKSALKKYLKLLKKNNQFDLNNKKLSFKNDKTIQNQLLITVAPDGFLKRL